MKKNCVLVLLFSLLLTVLLPATAVSAEQTKKVRVGWFPYPLSSEVHDGKYSGYTYDYLMEMTKYIDWEYEFVEADFASCCEMLRKGEIDLIGGLQKTPEREQFFDFSDMPFSQTYLDLFTTKDSPLKSYDFDNYNNINVGILKGSNNIQNFMKYANDNNFTVGTIHEYESNEELLAALKKGEIDAGVLLSYISTDENRIIAKFAPISIHFITTKGNKEILKDVNRSMSMIRINNVAFESKLYQKYYVNEESFDFTKEELAIIQASKEKPVQVGVHDECAPISCRYGEDGHYDGLAIKFFNSICEKIGLNIEYVTMDSSSDRKLEGNNLPSLVLGVPLINDDEDDTYRWYSDPLLEMPLSIVGKSDKDFLSGGKNETLAVPKGFSVVHTCIEDRLPDAAIKEYSTLNECLKAVAEGEADAAVFFRSCMEYYLQKPFYSELKLVSTVLADAGLCVASSMSQEKTLIHIIDKGVAHVSENEMRSITLDASTLGTYSMKLSDTIYKFRVPIIVSAILFLCAIGALLALVLVKRKSAVKLETANVRLNAALIEAKKASEAKGNFMSRISHEIRTPLNAVIGYNSIARNVITEAKTEPQRRHAEMKVMDCLSKGDIASRHLLTIINDVLDMSAIESGKIKVVNERFDFKGLISSLTAIFYSQAKTKGVNFNVEFDEQMDEWIIGDQMRVNQIITNLLSNAVKFTPDGGNVTLFIHPHTEGDTIKLHFEVRDSGIGMSEEYMTRIWNPFEQADSGISRRFGGTGLGLSITKSLVDLLEGSIRVESREGFGTTFFVDISFLRTEQPENHGTYDFSTINALVVDDDASTCDYIRLLFTRSGVRSSAVNSGKEAVCAVQKALEDNDPYSVCLIDWRMPKMDGLETVRKIREIAGDELPIFVVTAYDFTEIADKAAEVGVNMFISKPLFQSSLFNLLANISGSAVENDKENKSLYNFSGLRVLLTEDNAMNMEIARHILESANLTVDVAWNGKEAVDMFLAAPAGTYHAILMDVQMPVMDGYQATQAIRSSGHSEADSIPIIAMTADAFAENIAESYAAGMNDHISKPINLPLLFDTLKRYFE